MSEWLARAIDRAEIGNGDLASVRGKALKALGEFKWPTRKTEDWKYTPLRALESVDLSAAAPGVTVENLADNTFIPGLEAIELTFVDGALQQVPESLPAGLSIESLESGADLLNSAKPDRHLFGQVNDLLAIQGVVVRVAAGIQIEQPVRILSLLRSGAEAHNRVLVKLEKGASLSVVEQAEGSETSVNTVFCEYLLAPHSSLKHCRLALQSGAAISLGGCHFNLDEQSQLNSTVVGFGSQLSRLDVDIRHVGQHANAKMNAVYLLDGKELFDLHATVEHEVANGTTEENVRGIAAGQARAVFNGRIHIHRDAQKTLAELNNRNLLMSNKAEINTKPELEIYADDVRCAHGATVAEVDKRSLYYLQTRGISREAAQVMLSFGFINELIGDITHEPLANWLEAKLRERFSAMEVL